MDCLTNSACNLAISEIVQKASFDIDDDEADIVLKTSDGQLKAHKSVVRSCPYFAAIIDGSWIESQSAVITLDIFSLKSVKFVVEHMYKPKQSIDSNHDIGELITLVDMLGLQSLQELISSTMVVTVCHNFHKPCKDCIEGVMSTLQLASTYHLAEVRTKCLNWITKHFVKSWNSRPFSCLPEPLQQNCLKFLEDSMNVENIIDLTLKTEQLQQMLPSVKWAEPVKMLVKSLSTSCMIFMQQHFCDILHSAKFKSLYQIDTWSLGSVEAIISQAASNLPVEQACLSYLALEKITAEFLKLGEDQQPPDSVYLDFIKRLFKTVENRLIQRVGMATKCSAWDVIPKTKQTSIMQMGFFDPLDNHPKSSSDRPNPRNSLRRNHSLNAATASCDDSKSRTPNAGLTTGALQRTTLRATIHGGRNPINPTTSARTTGILRSSGVGNVQSPNRGVPETLRSNSARTANASASRSNTSRLNSNPVGTSCQRSTASRTPKTR
ncbi:hypothetical protein GHT06_018171 [Daphnia sinensis]|uniref:BTB domain-containing protein n=1 Tax=Daphnia sinensis TaxID=1820382 RepID=A0AAD5L431_9CRUS|nr:hypothetical protein GHT06_018171 [Daphnia sinensis]